MKKLTVICLILGIAVGMTACGKDAGLPPFAEMSALSDQQLSEKLVGLSVEDIHAAFGEPDGATFGFWADIYHFPDSHKVVFIYYDADGNVDTVKTDYRNE